MGNFNKAPVPAQPGPVPDQNRNEIATRWRVKNAVSALLPEFPVTEMLGNPLY